ncbi:hypothetical protein PG995_005464 [Apiospora arundinis]
MDEGYCSLASTLNIPSPLDSSPHKLFMSHDQYRPRDSNDYDNSLLKKFNAHPPRRSTPSSSANDAHPRFGPSGNRHMLLTPLSLAIQSMATEIPYSSVHSAVSPRRFPFSRASSNDYRLPTKPTDSYRSPLLRTRRASRPDDAIASTYCSFNSLEYQRMGLKRRPSSLPGDDLLMQGAPFSGQILRRREEAPRQSPASRLTALYPLGLQLAPRRLYASNIPLTTTIIASDSSFGMVSPNGPPPVDEICESPFNAPISLTHSPQSSTTQISHHWNSVDNVPLNSPRKLSDVSKTTMSRMQGFFFMCECCPKKSKVFDTAEELSAHAAEKQYECSFCGNRFKNKNEAERHQKSLHIRRHSWSCSTLHVAGYDKAFHKSSNRPGEADSCGYCGVEFKRSGYTGHTRHATEQDWDARLRHLQEIHKFQECNSTKKFFRADHFRQHLKHSHAGTSGKWTNMLEIACMMNEESQQR